MSLTTRSFEKLVATLCPNYKPDKIQLTKLKSGEIRITFISKGSICFIDISRTDWGFEPWAGHFDAYFKTGKFDQFAYWETYTSERIVNGSDYTIKSKPTGEFYKSKLGLSSSGEYTVHTDSWYKMLNTVREGNPGIGFNEVSKTKYKGA
jgi:hypothetical protein